MPVAEGPGLEARTPKPKPHGGTAGRQVDSPPPEAVEEEAGLRMPGREAGLLLAGTSGTTTSNPAEKASIPPPQLLPAPHRHKAATKPDSAAKAWRSEEVAEEAKLKRTGKGKGAKEPSIKHLHPLRKRRPERKPGEAEKEPGSKPYRGKTIRAGGGEQDARLDARPDFREMDADEASIELPYGWQVVVDKKSGDDYYWNLQTNATQWHHPRGEGEENPAAAAVDFGTTMRWVASFVSPYPLISSSPHLPIYTGPCLVLRTTMPRMKCPPRKWPNQMPLTTREERRISRDPIPLRCLIVPNSA